MQQSDTKVEVRSYAGRSLKDARTEFEADVATWQASGWRTYEQRWTGRNLVVTYVPRDQPETQAAPAADRRIVARQESIATIVGDARIISPALGIAGFVVTVAAFLFLWMTIHPV
jgi:hypothetical protein